MKLCKNSRYCRFRSSKVRMQVRVETQRLTSTPLGWARRTKERPSSNSLCGDSIHGKLSTMPRKPNRNCRRATQYRKSAIFIAILLYMSYVKIHVGDTCARICKRVHKTSKPNKSCYTSPIFRSDSTSRPGVACPST